MSHNINELKEINNLESSFLKLLLGAPVSLLISIFSSIYLNISGMFVGGIFILIFTIYGIIWLILEDVNKNKRKDKY